ncbi:unnamed protein product [Closterium sp. NIES-53]
MATTGAATAAAAAVPAAPGAACRRMMLVDLVVDDADRAHTPNQVPPCLHASMPTCLPPLLSSPPHCYPSPRLLIRPSLSSSQPAFPHVTCNLGSTYNIPSSHASAPVSAPAPAPVSASISVPAFDSAPAPVPAPIPVSAALQVVLYGVTQDGDSLCCRVPDFLPFFWFPYPSLLQPHPTATHTTATAAHTPSPTPAAPNADTAPSADTPSTPAAPSSTAAAAAASLPGTIGSSKAVSGQAGERGEESDGSDDDDDALAADGEEEAEEERDEGDILSEGDSDYSEGAPFAAMQEGADVNGRTSGTCQAGLLLGVEGLRDAEQQGGQGVSGGRRGGGRDGGEGGGEREEHVQGVCERVKRWVNVYVLGLAGRARSKGQNHIKGEPVAHMAMELRTPIVYYRPDGPSRYLKVYVYHARSMPAVAKALVEAAEKGLMASEGLQWPRGSEPMEDNIKCTCFLSCMHRDSCMCCGPTISCMCCGPTISCMCCGPTISCMCCGPTISCMCCGPTISCSTWCSARHMHRPSAVLPSTLTSSHLAPHVSHLSPPRCCFLPLSRSDQLPMRFLAETSLAGGAWCVLHAPHILPLRPSAAAPDPPPLLYISPTPPQSAPSSVPPPTADSHPPASSQHASTVTALPSRPPPLTHCPQCGVDMTARLGGTNTAQHPFAVSSTACAPAGNSPLSVLPPLARVSRCAVEFVSSWRSLQSLSPDVLSTHGTPDATQGGGTSVAPLPPAPVAAAPATSAPAEAAAASVAAQESKLNMSNSTNSTGVGHTITPITPSDAQINVAASPKHEPAVPPSPPADPALRTPHSLHASNTHTLHAPHPAPLHSKPLADGPSHPTPAYDGSGEESAGCAGKAETPDTREGGPSSSAKATETTAGAGTGRVGGMGGVADRSVLQLAPMVVLCMHVVSGAGGRVAAGAAGGGAGGRTGENGRRGGVGMFGAGRGLGRGGESRVKWGRELGEEGRGGDGDAGAGRTKRGRETVAEVAVADREEGGGACETGGEGSEERQEKTATVRGFFGVSVDSNAVESNVDEAGRSSESPPAGTKAEGVRTGSQGAGADVWWRPHGGAVSARGRAGGGSMGLGDRGGVSSGGKEGGGKHGSGRGKGQGNGKGKGKGKRKGNGRGGRGSGGGRGGVGGRMSPVSGESGRGGGTERAESVARPVHWWFGLRQGEGKEHSGSSGNTSHVRSTPPPNAPPRLHITPPATSSHPSPASSSRHTAIASAYHLPPPSPSPSATSQSAPAASRPPLNSPLPPSRVCLPSPAHSPLPSPLPSTPPAPSAPSPGDMESLGLMLGGGTTQATRDPILAIAHVINGTRRVGGRGKGARAGKVEGTGGGGESGEEREGRDKREGGTMEQGYMEDRERGFEHRVLIFTHCTASGAASGAASGVAGGAFGGRNAVASEGCEGIFAAREPEGTEPEWCREGYEGVGFMSSEMYGWGLQRDQERARERRQEKAQERRQEMEEEGEQKRGQERVGKPEDGARGRKAGGAEKEQVVGGREEVRVYRSEREMLQHWRRFFVFELDPDVVVVFQVSVR